MGQTEQQKSLRNAKIILGVIVVAFILIIGGALVRSLTEVKALNLYNIDQVDSGLSGSEINDLEGFVWQFLKDNQGFDDDKTGVIALIRPSSFVKVKDGNISSYEFLVDIDEFKTTYQVSFALVDGEGFYEAPDIGCPVKELMKYSDNCCNGRHVMEVDMVEECDG